MAWKGVTVGLLVALNGVLLGWMVLERADEPVPGSQTESAGNNPSPGAPGAGPPGCLASEWSPSRDSVETLVENLRRHGYIASVEEGVVERHAGFRVVAPGRVNFAAAAERAAEARRQGLDAFAATGADGRPTVSYGRFSDWREAERHRRRVAEHGFAAVAEPFYRTTVTARAVVMPQAPGEPPLGPRGEWRPVDCLALVW